MAQIPVVTLESPEKLAVVPVANSFKQCADMSMENLYTERFQIK